MPDPVGRIAENVARIRDRIAGAAKRSGRTAHDITLVAVTKYVSPDIVRQLVEAGCVDLGESRPQPFWEKAAALADLPIRWHMIGHLQRNKIRRTLPLTTMIHSVDSPRLLAAINEEWGARAGEPTSGGLSQFSLDENGTVPLHGPLPILLEVNISGESAKHGFQPGEVEPFLVELPSRRNVSVCGLMCMASFEGGPGVARREFAALRQLRDRLHPRCPSGVKLDQLSMGMSGDFEVAIEEGATIVRIGSALFEGVNE